jgi:hypothetical protein
MGEEKVPFSKREGACGFQTKVHTFNKYYNGPIKNRS